MVTAFIIPASVVCGLAIIGLIALTLYERGFFPTRAQREFLDANWDVFCEQERVQQAYERARRQMRSLEREDR